jgi:hypothetical protein
MSLSSVKLDDIRHLWDGSSDRLCSTLRSR